MPAPKIVFSSPYESNGKRYDEIEWPEGWPIPRVGESIETAAGDCLYVTSVNYYPQGEMGDGDPMIYLPLSDRAPR